jgi:hypothetical protein
MALGLYIFLGTLGGGLVILCVCALVTRLREQGCPEGCCVREGGLNVLAGAGPATGIALGPFARSARRAPPLSRPADPGDHSIDVRAPVAAPPAATIAEHKTGAGAAGPPPLPATAPLVIHVATGPEGSKSTPLSLGAGAAPAEALAPSGTAFQTPPTPPRLVEPGSVPTAVVQEGWNDRRDFFRAALGAHLLPEVAALVMRMLGCLLCGDRRFRDYRRAKMVPLSAPVHAGGQPGCATGPGEKGCDWACEADAMDTVDVVPRRACRFCGLARHHHRHSRELARVPDEWGHLVSPRWIMDFYEGRLFCPLFSCSLCPRWFVKCEEFQDRCSFCEVERRKRPFYQAIWYHRPLNVYRDPLLDGKVIRCKSVVAYRTNKGGRLVPYSTVALDVEATQRSASAHLDTFHRDCAGCGARFSVGDRPLGLQGFPAPADLCGFCSAVPRPAALLA